MSQSCPKCSAEIGEDFVFCPKCGSRVDHKTACTACGKLIADDSAVCPYCGVRRDGKIACLGCGKLLEPGVQFCQSCGAQSSQPRPVPAPAVYNNYAGNAPAPAYGSNAYAAPAYGAPRVRVKKDYKPFLEKLFGILTVSLGIGALFVMLLCCFLPLTTIRLATNVGIGSNMNLAQNRDIFFFFGEYFNMISGSEESLIASGMYPEGMYAFGVVYAVGLAACIATSLTFFIVGLVKGIQYLTQGKKCNMPKYVISAFVPWLVVSMLMSTFGVGMNASINGSYMRMINVPGGGLLSVLIVVPLFLAAMFVFKVILGHKSFNLQKILSAVGSVAVLLFAGIGVSLLSGNVFGSGVEEVYIALTVFLTACGAIGSVTMSSFQVGLGIMMIVLYVALNVIFALLAYSALCRLFDDKKPNFLWQTISGAAISVAFVSMIAAFSASHMEVAGISSTETIGGSLTAGAIVGVVMMFLALASAITFFVIARYMDPQRRVAAPVYPVQAYPGQPVYPVQNQPAYPVNNQNAEPASKMPATANQTPWFAPAPVPAAPANIPVPPAVPLNPTKPADNPLADQMHVSPAEPAPASAQAAQKAVKPVKADPQLTLDLEKDSKPEQK